MNQLIKYDAACRALAECKAVDEVKSWADKAAAMQAYGRMVKDKTMEVDAAEIRIRAERRLGDFSEKLQMLVCVWPHEHFVRVIILPPAWSAFDRPQRPFIAWMGRREKTDHAGKSRSRTEWPRFETGSVLGLGTMDARRNGSRRACSHTQIAR